MTNLPLPAVRFCEQMSNLSSYKAKVISVSTRAASGIWQDTSGRLIVEKLTSLGLNCAAVEVIADGVAVKNSLLKAVDQNFDLVITTGGTGHSQTDFTPEMTEQVIERDSPGISEAIRAYGISQGVFHSALSRAIAGIRANTLIINVPGSIGGARDAMVVLQQILPHALDQLRGGDHLRQD